MMRGRLARPVQLQATRGGQAPRASGPSVNGHAHGIGASAFTYKPNVAAAERGGATVRADYFRAAAAGVRGSAESLPHLRTVQAAFGRHAVTGVRAHVDEHASRASTSLGADAFTTGNDIAFRRSPDLRTVAHEAAHVVQQRRGVELPLGISERDDAYEAHANAVAESVVRGESAEPLLDRMAPSRDGDASGSRAVQRVATTEAISETTDTGNTYSQTLAVDTTARTMSVSIGINFVMADTWSSVMAFAAFIVKVAAAVGRYMNGMFTIAATPAPGSPAGLTAFDMPIVVRIVADSSGTPVNCHGGVHGRSAMQTGSGDLYELGQDSETTLPDVTIAHEFGHALLGASDEYANPAVPTRTISNDHSIMGQYYTQGIAAAEFKVRHFQHVLAPVAAHFPGYTLRLRRT